MNVATDSEQTGKDAEGVAKDTEHVARFTVSKGSGQITKYLRLVVKGVKKN